MADVFGDPMLFDEFEKERESCFKSIHLDKSDVSESENANTTVDFHVGESDSDISEADDERDTDADSPGPRAYSPADPLSSCVSEGVSDTDVLSYAHTDTGVSTDTSFVDKELDKALAGDTAPIPKAKLRNGGGISENHAIKIQALQKQLHKLTQGYKKLQASNVRLEQQKRLIHPSKYFVDGEGPAIQVLYMNHRVARKYKADIEHFIQSLFEKEGRRQMPEKMLDPRIHASAVQISDGQDTDLPQDVLRQNSSEMVIGCSQYFRNFNVDALGWPLVDDNPQLTDGWTVPMFEQVHRSPLPDNEVEEPAKPSRRPKVTCFNCGGEHRISDCKEKRDQRKINENKNAFLAASSSSSQSFSKQQSRYHADEDPRFAKFKPGVISETLRKAMGINANQLPPYIYQMRVLGYPPGHLEQMNEEVSAGFKMFDTHGKEVQDEKPKLEDGEVEGEAANAQPDVKKIVEYPGFNVDLPENCIDECAKFQMPPLRSDQSKSAMARHLSMSKQGKRKSGGIKRQLHEERFRELKKRRSGTETETADMDLGSSEGEDHTSTTVRHPAGNCAAPPTTRTAVQRPDSAADVSGWQPPPPPPLPPEPAPRTPPLPDSTPPPSPSHTPFTYYTTDQRDPLGLATCVTDAVDDGGYKPGSRCGSRASSGSSRAGAGSQQTSRVGTPTLEELEERRQLLQSELLAGDDITDSCDDDATTQSQEDTASSAAEDSSFLSPLPPSRLRQIYSRDTGSGTPSPGPPPLPQDTPPRPPPLPEGTPPPQRTPGSLSTPQGHSTSQLMTTPSSGGSISMALGTPVSGESSAKKDKGLPNSSKFADGIQEHLNFENLPESTGTYDRLRKVLDGLNRAGRPSPKS